MKLNSVYRLAEGVQVRNETFGLLFYDYRGPRLYFVPSKDLMDDTFFEGRQPVVDLLESRCGESPQDLILIHNQLKHVLEALEEKGLVHGKSIR